MKDKATAHLRIYVGNISDKVTEVDLYDHFKEYGTVTGIVVNRNFGFVQFEEEASAQAAISKGNGVVIQGKNINVRASQIQNIVRLVLTILYLKCKRKLHTTVNRHN